jgi:arylsulfatase A-like enzyme
MRDRPCRLWREGVLVAALAVTFAGGRQTTPAVVAQTRPLNVLLLVIDDVRWDSLGAAGSPVVKTPRLDRLAAEGVRFRNAYVTTSICMVSRASILTGQYMSRHGIRAFGVPIAPAAWATTYPARLRQAGYWTGFVGKYGVGQARSADFDVLRSYETTHWQKDDDGREIHVTEKNAQDSLRFLRNRPRDRPFALSVSFFAAHAEDAAREQYKPQAWSEEAYRGITMPPPIHGDPKYLDALPPFLRAPENEGRIRFGWRFDTPARYQDYLKRYFRLITEVDRVVGLLLDELGAQGVGEETLVLFIGDNGYFQGDRGLADKWYPYEESIRVPLLVRDPRVPTPRRGQVLDQMVLNIDLAPTVLRAAGQVPPEAMQGVDLSPLYLGDRPPEWREEFLYEHPTITSKQRIPSSIGVVRRNWKFIRWPEYDVEQFFDLTRDPDEIHDLAGDAASAPRVAAGRARLAEWQVRVR